MPDNTFASGILGDGFAIMPTDGTIHAPVDGTVTALYSSKHAIGITGPDGLEVLVHIGLNTVQLEGRYFEAYVKLSLIHISLPFPQQADWQEARLP